MTITITIREEEVLKYYGLKFFEFLVVAIACRKKLKI